MQQVEALLKLLQLVCGVRQAVQTVTELLGGVLRLIHQVRDRVVQRLQRLIEACAVRQIALCLRQESRRALRLVPAVQTGGGIAQTVRELFGILQQTAAGLELRVLIRLQSRTLDLIDLIAQRLRAAELFTLVHAQVRHFALQALHDGKLCAVLLQQRCVSREAVQKCQMVVLIEQRCGVVLAVDVDELQAEPPQNADRDGHAVHAAEILSVQIDLTLYDDLRVIGHTVLGKPRKLRHIVKNGANGGEAPVRIISR